MIATHLIQFFLGGAGPVGEIVLGTRYPDPSRSTIRVLADEPGTYAARVRVLPATPDSSRIKQL